jgi:hypothetical protein
MAAVEMGGIADIEMTHEFGKIPERCLNKKVIMVGHKDITVNNYPVITYGFQ